MDPEQQLSPEVMQMLNALGSRQGQGNMFGMPPAGPMPDMAAPEMSGWGGLLPGLGEQTSSLGNEDMPMVPPPAMSDTGFAPGPEMGGPSFDGGMPSDVSQMVASLQAGGGDGTVPEIWQPGQPGLDAGLTPSADAGMAGQWAPGTGQVPDFSQAITPQGAANGTPNPFGVLGQGK